MVVAILALIQKIPWYLIALSVIASMGFVFFAINQFETRQDRHKKKLSQLSDKEIEDTIRKWVDIPEYTYRRSDVDVKGAYFIFDLTDTVGRPIHVTRNIKDPHCIGIWSDLGLLPADNEYPGLPEKKLGEIRQIIKCNFDKIKQKLSLEILRLGCYYHFYEELGVIRLVNDVYLDDSLNASEFISQCLFVTRAMTLVQLVLLNTLGELGINVQVSGKEEPQT